MNPKIEPLLAALRLFTDVVTDADIVAAHAKDWSGSAPSMPAAVVRPASTAEVSRTLAACHEAEIAVVPQGGLSGLVGGAVPHAGAIALSMKRLREGLAIDAANATMVCPAGLTLAEAQDAADAAGFLLPLDLGARGSATIGGNISTNAGGMRVIRYGMMREIVLGLEAVLADGTVLSSMNRMIKNNAGYDLKHLFIGAEGTLGVVTQAVLRLRPKPASENTGFVALKDFDSTVRFLSAMRLKLGATLSTFEVMWGDYYGYVTSRSSRLGPPLAPGRAFYVLIEATGSNPEADAAAFEMALSSAVEEGLIEDAAIANSDQQRRTMFAIRDDVGDVLRTLAPVFGYDVSMPILTMGSFADDVKQAMDRRFPGNTTFVLGHMGDGNLHLVVSLGSKSADVHAAADSIIYEAVRARGGSVSAEHGIGLEKKAYLGYSRSPAEIAAMRAIKAALDPKNLLNPGKIF
jgi:FAD/FMN-containing dehydrogenase